MDFAEKLISSRLSQGLTRRDLAAKAQIDEKSLWFYETRGRFPRRDILRKLASALDVPLHYLQNDDDAGEGQGGVAAEQTFFVEYARETYGSRGAREAEQLLQRVSALFAGGELDAADKEIFFQDIMEAHLEAKAAAREKFTPRTRRSKS